jgi:hypothetical protein
LIEGNCANIETNLIITDSKGKEIRLCNDAPTLFEWSFPCLWLLNDGEDKHFCTTVHFLTDSFLFYFLFVCVDISKKKANQCHWKEYGCGFKIVMIYSPFILIFFLCRVLTMWV